MIVLYPVLVLSVIAGSGFVYADDPAAAAPAPAPNAAAAPAAAPAAASAAAPNAAPAPVASAEVVTTTTTAAPPKTAANVTTAPTTKAVPVPNTITSTNDNEEAPLADNYISPVPAVNDAIDRERLAATLDRITKVLDASPSTGKGTAAVPLLPGKNYDFFLLKVPKHDPNEPTTEKPPPKPLGRNLEPMINENSMGYPVSAPQLQPQPQPQSQAQCPCAQPPQQIIPDLSALQSIYGSALNLNALLDPVCPPGLVPVVVLTDVTDAAPGDTLTSQPIFTRRFDRRPVGFSG